MGLIDNVKEVADLVKKVGDVELYRKIVELEQEIFELSRENRIQKDRIDQLEKMLTQIKDMKFNKPFYYLTGDPNPYCPKCWEVATLSVHLTGPIKMSSGQEKYDCPNCNNYFLAK
jgi:hypothetical protein